MMSQVSEYLSKADGEMARLRALIEKLAVDKAKYVTDRVLRFYSKTFKEPGCEQRKAIGSADPACRRSGGGRFPSGHAADLATPSVVYGKLFAPGISRPRIYVPLSHTAAIISLSRNASLAAVPYNCNSSLLKYLS